MEARIPQQQWNLDLEYVTVHALALLLALRACNRPPGKQILLKHETRAKTEYRSHSYGSLTIIRNLFTYRECRSHIACGLFYVELPKQSANLDCNL